MLNSILLNTANVLYIFCYGVRDVLWLRILAVAAMFLLLPFYANQPEPLIVCMAWQLVFIAINVYWIAVIIRERRPPNMTEEEHLLYDNVFKDCCTPKEMLTLLSRAEWKEAPHGARIIERKTTLNQLLLIHRGIMSVQVKGKEVTSLESGNLIGEMSFLTQGTTIADVIADGPVRYLSWQRSALEELFETKVELKSAIHELIGRDLVQKLITHNKDADLLGTLSL